MSCCEVERLPNGNNPFLEIGKNLNHIEGYEFDQSKPKAEAVVIDDHRLVATGLGHLVSRMEQIDRVYCVASPSEFDALQIEGRLRLIICDLYIPGYDTLQSIKQFKTRYPSAKVVVISASISRSDYGDALAAGADCYLEKHADPMIVERTLTSLLQNVALEDEFCARTAQSASQIGLSERQIETLIFLARGYSTKDISRRLSISPETVKTHLSQIYHLIGFSGRSAASEWARANGLV